MEHTREIGIIGLGKMGSGIARHLMEKGWKISGYDPEEVVVQQLKGEGMKTARSAAALVEQLSTPRLVWLMVPAYVKTSAGKPAVSTVDDVLFGRPPAGGGIAAKLSKGDIVVDGGNSYYKDTIARAKKIEALGVSYVDVGFSGGPSGARNGGCLMIGGDEKIFRELEPLFRDLSVEGGYQFFSGAGAGHFVKMVHNGIEYGMMQSLAEGFAILQKSPYKLDLKRVADIYDHGSVIESRLTGWLKAAFEQHGDDLEKVSGSVGHTGEGEWTAKTAKELGIAAKIIEESFQFRVESAKKPSFTGKVVSALRGQFGGHKVKK